MKYIKSSLTIIITIILLLCCTACGIDSSDVSTTAATTSETTTTIETTTTVPTTTTTVVTAEDFALSGKDPNTLGLIFNRSPYNAFGRSFEDYLEELKIETDQKEDIRKINITNTGN